MTAPPDLMGSLTDLARPLIEDGLTDMEVGADLHGATLDLMLEALTLTLPERELVEQVLALTNWGEVAARCRIKVTGIDPWNPTPEQVAKWIQ